MTTATRVPFVDYLVLGDDPHLVANACTSCGARYFDRRNACAACGGLEFTKAEVSKTGVLKGYSIVAQAAPGIAVPFVAGIVDCAGTTVRTHIVNVAPDPRAVHVGLKVRLVTTPVGSDSRGVEAVAYAFEPLEGAGA